MSQILSKRITLSVFSVFALFVCGSRVQATDISGTISTTLTIFDDSELVGDVTCTVRDAPSLPMAAPQLPSSRRRMALMWSGSMTWRSLDQGWSRNLPVLEYS